MLAHRVIVRSSAPAAIRADEYAGYKARFAHICMPIERTPQYRMMLERGFPRRTKIMMQEFEVKMM